MCLISGIWCLVLVFCIVLLFFSDSEAHSIARAIRCAEDWHCLHREAREASLATTHQSAYLSRLAPCRAEILLGTVSSMLRVVRTIAYCLSSRTVQPIVQPTDHCL